MHELGGRQKAGRKKKSRSTSFLVTKPKPSQEPGILVLPRRGRGGEEKAQKTVKLKQVLEHERRKRVEKVMEKRRRRRGGRGGG